MTQDTEFAGRAYTARELCELDARDFLEEDTWKRWKQKYDEAMAFRKTLKGKPTDEQRLQLEMNSEWIMFCDTILWHSVRMGPKCVCRKCDLKRKAAAAAK